MSHVNARRCGETLSNENARGRAIDRSVNLNTKAKRGYGTIPTIAIDRQLDPIASEHLQDVGRRMLILCDTNKRVRKESSPTKSPKRVSSLRFSDTEFNGSKDASECMGGEEEEEDSVKTDERIANMIMDQEWDTRAWNAIKIQTAIETLYTEIEHSDDESRRKLATSMLVRLMQTHKDAVEYVETSLPSLTNKAFCTLSKRTNNSRIYRLIELIAVLAAWFAHVLSNENVLSKISTSLLRETEVCAQLLQHHWREFLFKRAVTQRECDPIIRSRFHAMHIIKLVDLRHQFKTFREVVGPEGIPDRVTHAYVTIVYHLVNSQRGPDPKSEKTRRMVLLDQRRLLNSGVLVHLASLITRRQSREFNELVKGIVGNLLEGHGDDQIVYVLQCNVVQRVQVDLMHTLQSCDGSIEAISYLTSSLRILHDVVFKVVGATERWGPHGTDSAPSSPSRNRELASVNSHNLAMRQGEREFLMQKLKTAACQFLFTADVFETLFEVLFYCREQRDTLRVQVLDTFRLLARSVGFSQFLDALTRRGSPRLELVLRCMNDTNMMVARAAVNFFYTLTSHADARRELTTAGAVEVLMGWCQPTFEECASPMAFVLGLIGCALLARQTQAVKPATALLEALNTLEERVDALYNLLLDLAMQDETSPRASEQTASFLLNVNVLPTMLQFITKVSPSCMDAPIQNARQRNISCIFLGRLFKASSVTQACFSEEIVTHLALSIQCNRLDELKGNVARTSSEDRLLYEFGSLEACKALSRLARCPSHMVQARLRLSMTCSQVPEWPQALLCDVLFRLHVLEALIAFIRPVSEEVEGADITRRKVVAAVELTGYLRPLPSGQRARAKFLKSLATHAHGNYVRSKVMQLVKLVAPAILRLLRDKNAGLTVVSACCVALNRLACTNEACHALLGQGCLQSTLIHFPDIAMASKRPRSLPKTVNAKSSSFSEHHELLNVPSSLYKLIGRLCSIAEGRTGILRAQVLPRLLKRLQMQPLSSQKCDDECKSEIAFIISQLAVVNAIEGSTGELFVHYRVLELLTTVLEQCHDVRYTWDFAAKRNNAQVSKWRLLVHVVHAIAALSQDILVVVPRVVELDIVGLLFPFLARFHGESPLTSHLESLQYDAVSIIRSVASYPHGLFHVYLLNAKASVLDQVSRDKTNVEVGASDAALSPLLMDRIKRIAFDYAMELKLKPVTLRDEKSVGELARESLALINEHQQQLQVRQEDEGYYKSSLPSAKKSKAALASSPSLKSFEDRAVIPNLSTLSAGNKQSEPSAKTPCSVLTKLKANTRSSAYCLMLDPLFNSSADLVSGNMNIIDDLQYPTNERNCFGHYANVQARQLKKRDSHCPSIGRSVTSNTSFAP